MSSQPLTHGTAPVAQPMKGKSIWSDIVTCFRSVQLAIVLLSLLAIGTIIGVVMPQEGMVELATIREKYGNNFELLRDLGCFNVYSSFWFITLQILFFFNLLIGSFKWLKPATLAAIQKPLLTPEVMALKPDAHSLPVLLNGSQDAVQASVVNRLKALRYGVHQSDDGRIYASKGNITRLGPSIAHLGILICLIAGVYSSFTGFKAVRMAIPGETFSLHEANTFKTNVPQPIWLGSVPEWKVRVNDFQVEFYEDHPQTAKQYYSKLDVVNQKGQVLKSETISVNHPLVYDNISIYQASYAPTGRFLLTMDGKPLTVTVNSQFNQRPISITELPGGSSLIMFPFFAQQDPGVTQNYAVFFLRKPGEPINTGVMPENIRLTQGRSGSLKGHTITYLQPEMSTGLQIKRAPEVPLMYASYLIIALGAVLCFFSQRRVWLALKEVRPHQWEASIYPQTNKGWISFRQELAVLQATLMRLAPPQPTVEGPRR